MDDGRSPSGGADKQKGGKGGYVLDSRAERSGDYCRYTLLMTVIRIIKTVIRIIIKTNIIPILITVYNAERSGAYIINDLINSSLLFFKEECIR